MSTRFRQFLRNVSAGYIIRRIFHGMGLFSAGILISEHFYTVQGSEGPSMYPTFSVRGDYLLVSRRYDHGRDIKVGDVVRFNHPSFFGVYGAKRVLGMPGDFVCKDPAFSTEVGAKKEMIQVCISLLPCFFFPLFLFSISMVRSLA